MTNTKKHWSEKASVQQFIRLHRKCECCGKAVGNELPHHKIPKARRGDARIPHSKDLESWANLARVCLQCHTRYNDAVGQNPSPSPSKRDAHARNVRRLFKRWPMHKWLAMCPAYVKDAYCDKAIEMMWERKEEKDER
jgi:hypothetical protein